MRISKWLMASTLVALAACATDVQSEDFDDVEVDPLVAGVFPTVCGTRIADAPVRGIDISKWQGTIDWPAVKQSGISFAVARVSDGSTVKDQTFALNYQAMGAAGLVRGAYQFFRPTENALVQAKLFVASVNEAGGWKPGDMPPMLDIEVSRTSRRVLQTGVKTWLAYVQKELGVRPIIYTYPSISYVLGGCFVGEYPMWIASYQQLECPAMPPAWVDGGKSWSLWQHSDHGTVPGIKTPVDMNIFNGTSVEFEKFRSDAVLSDAERALVPLDAVSCAIAAK